LRGSADSRIETVIDIVPYPKYPFRITKVNAKSGKFIGLNLSEKNGAPGGGYTLYVENLKREKGRYYDTIVLKTDSPIKPEIRIGVSGYIEENIPGREKTKQETVRSSAPQQ